MKIVDANVVLRYILDDHERLSQKAADILKDNEVFVPFEVLSEIVYVLQKVYQVPRADIQAKITELLNSSLILTEKPKVLKKALALYAEKNIDIVDAILCAYKLLEAVEIFTFDRKLRKCLEG